MKNKNPYALVGILGGLVLISLFAVGIHETLYNNKSQDRAATLEKKWRTQLEYKYKTLKHLVPLDKDACEGRFTVRYRLDGLLNIISLPYEWECSVEQEEEQF
jgi:hypothetical protein